LFIALKKQFFDSINEKIEHEETIFEEDDKIPERCTAANFIHCCQGAVMTHNSSLCRFEIKTSLCRCLDDYVVSLGSKFGLVLIEIPSIKLGDTINFYGISLRTHKILNFSLRLIKSSTELLLLRELRLLYWIFTVNEQMFILATIIQALIYAYGHKFINCDAHH